MKALTVLCWRGNGGKKVEPRPDITLEKFLCDCEQRNGVTAELREKLVLLYIEKHPSTVVK